MVWHFGRCSHGCRDKKRGKAGEQAPHASQDQRYFEEQLHGRESGTMLAEACVENWIKQFLEDPIDLGMQGRRFGNSI